MQQILPGLTSRIVSESTLIMLSAHFIRLDKLMHDSHANNSDIFIVTNNYIDIKCQIIVLYLQRLAFDKTINGMKSVIDLALHFNSRVAAQYS